MLTREGTFYNATVAQIASELRDADGEFAAAAQRAASWGEVLGILAGWKQVRRIAESRMQEAEATRAT